MVLKHVTIDRLSVQISKTAFEMGYCAAKEVAKLLKDLLKTKDEVNMIFAAAPSQFEFLDWLAKEEGIEWGRVNVFHMDEYIGLKEDAPQSFAGFIKKYVVDKLKPKAFFPIIGNTEDLSAECGRYAELLARNKPDIVCCGIGENGHIAFNDPWEADFWEEKRIKITNLDEKCRRQQVNDKCFDAMEEVPKKAITLTIPMLMSADAIFCIVPGQRKANAVKEATLGKVETLCPASILRVHKNAKLYCDESSGVALL